MDLQNVSLIGCFQKVGTSPSMSIFAAVFSTGLLSAWIENVVAFAMLTSNY